MGNVSDARHEGRSCLEASASPGQSVARPLAHSHDLRTARGMPGAHVIDQISLLEVEPMYLARVYEATRQNAGVEMRRLCHRARGSHAKFHVRELHRVELVYRGTNESARLVIPASCR